MVVYNLDATMVEATVLPMIVLRVVYYALITMGVIDAGCYQHIEYLFGRVGVLGQSALQVSDAVF